MMVIENVLLKCFIFLAWIHIRLAVNTWVFIYEHYWIEKMYFDDKITHGSNVN